MVIWQSLSEVEDSRARGDKVSFDPALAWIVNIDATNQFPSRFVYSACNFRHPSGRHCNISLEQSRMCREGHKSPSRLAYRFKIRLVDAHHKVVEPLSAQIWEWGADLLGIPADEFSTFREADQLLYVAKLTQSSRRVRIWLSTKDSQINVSHLIFVDGRPPLNIPRSLESPQCSQGRAPQMSPKSTGKSKKLLADAIENLARQLKLVDDDE